MIYTPGEWKSTTSNGEFSITNTGQSTVKGWTLQFQMPSGTEITGVSGASYTNNGDTFTLSPLNYTTTIQPGQSVTIKLQIRGLGAAQNCLIDNAPCSGIAAPADTTPPAAPSGLAVSTGATSATVSWQASTSPDAAHYLVYRNGALINSTSSTQVTWPTLRAGIHFNVAVVAVDAAGNQSGPLTGGGVTSAVANSSTVHVSNATQLQTAIGQAKPGDVITLAPGRYEGSFVATTSGTAARPITLIGPSSAVLVADGRSQTVTYPVNPSSGGGSNNYGLWIANANHWHIVGVTITDSNKGIVIDHGQHLLVDGVTVKNIGDEGIHFRTSSADGVVENSTITNAGTKQPQYGEGIYVGSANSNWSRYGFTNGMDASDRTVIINNVIGPNVRGEHIDIKEGTQGGVVSGNTFFGQGISGQNSADSWVDVKGNGYLLAGNSGNFTAPGVFAHGFETHRQVEGWGCGNVFRDNYSDLGGVGGLAFNIVNQYQCVGNYNQVLANNSVTGATRGLTNINYDLR